MKKVAFVLLILLIVITSIFFYKDAYNINSIVYNYPSDRQDTSALFFYPQSEYLIEINDLKQRQFQCNIWLKDFNFFYLNREKSFFDSTKFGNLLLRSYIFDSTLKYPNKIDWIVTFLENKEGSYCYEIPSFIETLPSKSVSWTPNIETSIFYPFDYYKFHLDFEEQASYIGMVTNISPEKITVNCKAPNFIITKNGLGDFELSRSWTFKTIAIVFLVLISFYTIYLWSNKSKTDVLAQSIGLFTGVWSIRTIISTNAPVFPTIIDYFTLLIFIALGTLLIFKTVDKKSDT
ncbi:hypothetical protein [Agriterribacter humi]|uniref:hypothetical protein n=1 Tax=Agriterribacter humi TaxID=1104781 RepID=UPI0012640B9B|nr:hypothetical protein [Agriterribacter humi]